MNYWKAVFLLFFGFNLNCQIILNDSTLAFAPTTTDIYASKSIGAFCYFNGEVSIKANKILIISDAIFCKDYSFEKYFYEIAYRDTTYFVKQGELDVGDKGYFEQLRAMPPDVKEKYKIAAKNFAKYQYNKELQSQIKFYDKCKALGLVLEEYSIYDESEYTEGTSFKITVSNPTKKKIKYVYITITGYNAVDDPVRNRNYSTKYVLTGIGPIEPDHSATYESEYVWMTDIVETVKINQIKVQYMDGTVKIIANPQAIRMNDEQLDLLEFLKEKNN